MPKFAISGTHSTGKTTLVDLIENQSCNVSIVREVPRAICQELNDPQYFYRDHNSFAKQTLLIAKQIAMEAMALPAGKVIVTDRCVADHWAYTQVQFPKECVESAGTQWGKLVSSWMQTYDAIFVCSVETALEDDGVREADLDFRQTIDYQIRMILKKAESQVIDMNGPTAERLNAFIAATLECSTQIDWQNTSYHKKEEID